MKALLFTFLAICSYGFVSVTAVDDPDICAFDDVKLGILMRCVREKAWLMLRNGLDHLLHVYQCQSDTCVFNKICDEGDVTTALNKYMKPKPRREFWEIAKKCEKELPPDDVAA
ncbi:antimicrobial peptide microplusin-like [Rhipicephalus microplus]|uniref:antimicrobial peptide microplusin-like n=1 Tax=Rhipicephalus microplus TaxID=6941 RepID=UPI003F6D869C